MIALSQKSAIRNGRRAAWLDWAGIALLAVILLAPALLTTSQYYLNVLVMMGTNAILATGLAIVVRAGRLSLAQASFGGIGGYASGILVMRFGLNYWLALPAAALIAATVGVLLGLSSLRLRGFYFAIATFTFSQIAIVILRAWTPVTGGMSGMFGLPHPPDLLGLSFADPRNYYFLTLVFTVLSITVYYACSAGTRFGRGITVLGEDEVLARALGVAATRYRIIAFAISSFIGGIGGSLSAHFIQGISPSDIEPIASVFIVVMVMAGGARTLFGPLLGAIILTGVPELLRASAQWSMVFHGLFLLAYVFFFPTGLLPIMQTGVRRVLGLAPTAGETARQQRAAGPLPQSYPRAPRAAADRDVPMLRFENMSCAFGDLTVLKDIDWEIRSGEINGLIGPNGAGKTTFFNVVTGVAPLSRGRLFLNGRLITPSPESMAREGIARTFQHARVLQNHSVVDALCLGAELAGRPLDPGRIEWLLARLNLRQARDLPGSALTHYQRRLVTIGMAMAGDPALVLLDEPLAGLDDTETEELGRIIAKLHAEAGNTVLLIEHKLSVVMRLCSWLTVLDYGQIIAEGDPETIAGDAAVIKAYLGNE